MKKLNKTLLAVSVAAATSQVQAGAPDDPVLIMGKLDQLEVRKTGGTDPIVAEGFLWIGKDLNKFWLNVDAEKVGSKVEELETQALYSRGIATYWDFQVGWRRDHKPAKETRDWLVVGFNGLAPYFFDVDAQLFLGENGRGAARLSAEYEMLFTQRLRLIPEFTVNAYTRNDPAVGKGSGLSDLNLGLRLAYQVKREFEPYVGVNWNRKFGKTADYARDEGAAAQNTQLVLGVRAWF